MQDSEEEIQRRGATVVAIGQGSTRNAIGFCHGLGVRFPCIGDPTRASYRAYGLPVGSVQQVTFVRHGRAETLRAARAFGIDWKGLWLKESNWWQLPGLAIIDRSGTLRYLHRAKTAADFPPPERIYEELEAIGEGGVAAPARPQRPDPDRVSDETIVRSGFRRPE